MRHQLSRKALTDPEELSAWFGDSAEVELEVGGEGWFGWEKHGRFPMRVVGVDPERRFAWRWGHEPGASFDEARSTLVEWTLEPRADGGTTLHLRESECPSLKRRNENDRGWTEELEEFVALLDRTA